MNVISQIPFAVEKQQDISVSIICCLIEDHEEQRAHLAKNIKGAIFLTMKNESDLEK